MALGTVYVDGRFRNAQGQVLVMGRVLLGYNDVIRPKDLELTVIKSIIFQPWAQAPVSIIPGSVGSMVGKSYIRSNPRQVFFMQGSIGSLNTQDTSAAGVGSLGGNYVRVKSGRITTVGTTGQLNKTGGVMMTIGTVGGSLRGNYLAVGL